MGKSAPKAPDPPNPFAVAAAQTASNNDTARLQATLNRVNQVTPYGDLTYTQQGPDQWTATTTLSPAEQQNLELSNQGQQIYGQTAVNQLGQASGALSTPIQTDYSQYRDQYLNSQRALMQPDIDRQREQLRSQLANQGVAQGSDAYNNAWRQQTNAEAQMEGNLLANAQNMTGSAIQQQIALRDQPLNEASALLSGSQVSQPTFQNVPQTQVAPTNLIGAVGDYNSAKTNAYNAQLQANQGKAGGMGQLAGTLGTAAMKFGPMLFSDRRVKEDIHKVGELENPDGAVPVKSFRYKGDPVKRIGVIAQDLEKHPNPAISGAVVTHPRTGVKGVNYAQVLAACGPPKLRSA